MVTVNWQGVYKNGGEFRKSMVSRRGILTKKFLRLPLEIKDKVQTKVCQPFFNF
jgi:hypothetical protein